MDFGHYTDRTAMLAAELVNAFADPGGSPTVDELRTLLGAYGVLGTVGAREIGRLRALADLLRPAFGAADGAAATRQLNLLLAEVQPRPFISTHDGQAGHLHYSPAEAGTVANVAASTAVSLAVVLCDHGKERLGQCLAESCRRVFVDTSRNAQRRYCSESCANRSHVAAHRARARAIAPAEPA